MATERLWELFDAGESVEEIAASYELSETYVSAAIAYEDVPPIRGVVDHSDDVEQAEPNSMTSLAVAS